MNVMRMPFQRFTSEAKADRAARYMVRRSAWFTLEPRPDDEWELTFKAGEGLEGPLAEIEATGQVPAGAHKTTEIEAELISALEDCIEVIEDELTAIEHEEGEPAHWHRAIDAARASIAKATGQPNT